MHLISAKHLPRDLKIIGVIAFIFAGLQILYFLFLPKTSLILHQCLTAFLIFLSTGFLWFALAKGVSKKEKWAWSGGIFVCLLSIISSVTFILLKASSASIVYGIIGILLPILFLVTFLKGKDEITVSANKGVSFSIWVVSLLINIIANGYLVYLSFYIL